VLALPLFHIYAITANMLFCISIGCELIMHAKFELDIKDMLLCGGYNVYPRNIEEAIYQHPAVAEVCVIGVPDPYRGQSPKAFIALKPRSPVITLEEMKSFLKSRLGKHEMISELEIRDSLPRTPVGKLSKKELAEEEVLKRARVAKL
jgi:long-chain acyl-CoA synthetase